MRILVLALRPPFPPDDGGKHRLAHVVRYLAREHEVVLVCFGEGSGGTPGAKDADGRPDRLVDLQIVPAPPAISRLRTWFGRDPSEVYQFSSAEMTWRLDALITRFSPEVLLVSEPRLTGYVAAHTDRVRILDYVCVDTLQFERLQTLATTWQRPLWALRRMKIASYLRRIAPQYDLCLVNSEEDRTALLTDAPGWTRVEVLPNGLDLSQYPLGLATPEPDTLVYAGAVTYGPNRDGVAHFIREIFPAVRAQVGNARLLITGRVPSDGVAPRGPGVTYTGYVPDVRPIIAGAWMSPVPLRAGAGGTRFKVLEALALGTPMVSTRIGAEGVAVTHGLNILKAEAPAAFAAETVRLLRSTTLRTQLATAGRRLIEERYNWKVLGARLVALAAELVDRRR
jgi:glycosyltransferase involved in cell wall biosynthesis